MSLFLVFDNNGWFVAHCTVTWEDDGFNQQSQSSDALTKGTNYTVTLPDTAKNLHLHVEHDTGLVWKPHNVTGDLTWSDPAGQFKDGKATVEAHGTTLTGFGLTWTDHP